MVAPATRCWVISHGHSRRFSCRISKFPGFERISTIGAQSFIATGGSLVNEYGYDHYQAWGDPGHTLEVQNVTVPRSGRYAVQLFAGNGAGGFTTGVTCAVKRIEVFQGNTLVDSGYAMMPHLETWNAWRESSFVFVDLAAGNSYRIVISEDGYAVNMSERAHFEIYGGTGGTGGRFNRVNIAQVKLLGTSLQ